MYISTQSTSTGYTVKTEAAILNKRKLLQRRGQQPLLGLFLVYFPRIPFLRGRGKITMGEETGFDRNCTRSDNFIRGIFMFCGRDDCCDYWVRNKVNGCTDHGQIGDRRS